jgi:hypothetical protein
MTSMIACNLLVQVPPDALDRVQVRRVLRQEVKDDAIAMLGQVLTHRPAVMETGVVADHMNLPVAAQPRAEVVQMPDEQRRVAARRTWGPATAVSVPFWVR